MKYSTPLVAVSLAAACSAALATEYGTVISSTAVTAPVAVGHNLGEGFGRAAAMGLGAVAGRVIGDRTEAAGTPAAAVPVRSCQTVTSDENRTVGDDVTCEFNGQRYTTRVAQDPGERIALNVSVAPSVVYSSVPTSGYHGPCGYCDGGPVMAVEPRVVIGGDARHGF